MTRSVYDIRPLGIGLLAVLLALPADGWAQRIEATVDSAASRIAYTGSAPLHDWTGTSRSVTGAFVLDPTHADSSRAVITAPVASFDSGNDRRDRKMREVTGADTHPLVQFRATEIRPMREGSASAGRSGRWAASGTLTFHGETHPIDATVDVQVQGDSVRARAEFPVSLTQFEVERPQLMWVSIADTIRIDAQVVGRIDSSALQRLRRQPGSAPRSVP